MSLRFQINLGIFLSILIILSLGGAAAIWQARISVSKEVESSVNLAYQLIVSGITQPALTLAQQKNWLSQVVSLRQTRHLMIQLEDEKGQIIQLVDNKPNQETVSPPDWFVWAVSVEYPSAKYQIHAHDGRPLKIIIHPNPLDEIRESWEETRSFIFSVAVMGLILFFAVNLIFKRALHSVSVILSGLRSIEKGDYQKKMPDFQVSEFGMIARAINHLTDALATAKKENSALALHSLEIQEEERQKLARELHDELGQSVTAIKAMAVTGKQENSDAHQINDSIISICDHLFTAVRTMMKNLHPIVLSELGLKASLEDLVDHWAEKNPKVNFTISCDNSIDDIAQKKTIQIFRVIQECLTNIARHADAEEVRIELKMNSDNNNLLISVNDDGKGCDLRAIKQGFGLMGIRERIENLGGKINFISSPGKGMKISANIPYFLIR